MIRKLTADEVTFEITTESEDRNPRGNVMCTDDPEQDRRDEQEILNRLNAGDESAWCVVVVTATYVGPDGSEYIGQAALGGCSFAAGCGYDCAKELDECVEAHGMREEALADLNNEIGRSLSAAEELAQHLVA